MTKTVIITLTVEIPETELSKDVVVTIGTNTYKGKLMAIVTHKAMPSPLTVSLEGVGLKVTTPP